MKHTIWNLDGQREYVSLPNPLWEGRVEIGTGVFLTRLYRGSRTGRMVEKTVSQWQGSPPCSYTEIGREDFAGRCEFVGIDIPAAIEAKEL